MVTVLVIVFLLAIVLIVLYGKQETKKPTPWAVPPLKEPSPAKQAEPTPAEKQGSAFHYEPEPVDAPLPVKIVRKIKHIVKAHPKKKR